MSALPDWYDPEDERTCRAVWSRLAEPGDDDAWGLVASLGAGPALRLVVEGGLPAATGRQGRRRSSGPPTDLQARWRVRLSQADPRQDLAMLARVKGRLLIPGDEEWPDRLADLGVEAPFCLWVRGAGHLAALTSTQTSVSLVGARATTPYGERVAIDLATGCVERGLVVVSGAAYGVDAAAHRATLGAGGATVAVLACGVDRAYPRANEALIERIAVDGCVVAEVPPSSSPTRWRFVERNRLIAALTRGTVVIEAAWRSGALGTALRALAIGRPVGAVPGPVTATMSAGCHRLLRMGAVCVTDADELVELVSPIGAVPEPERAVEPAEHDGLDPVGLRVYEALPLHRPVRVASVARTAGLEEPLVAATLGRLEMGGLAEHGPTGWRRARPSPRQAERPPGREAERPPGRQAERPPEGRPARP